MALSRNLLVTASFDKSVRVWDLNELTMVNTKEATRYLHTGKAKPQAVALQNGRLFIGFDDKSIAIYSIT